jgi:hypothetical protein
MRFLPVGLLLFASTALGQTLTLTVDNNTETNPTIGLNRDDCGRDLSVTWTFVGTACEAMQLWVTTGTCGDAPAAGDYVLDEVPAGSVGVPGNERRSIDVERLPIFTTADGGAGTCATARVDETMRVCAYTEAQTITGCDAEINVSSPPKLRFDTQPPNPPTIDAVRPRDSALGVTVSGESDSTIVVTAYPLAEDGTVGEAASSDETTSTDGVAELANLQNGVTYRLTAVATDASGNPSEASAPAEGTPVASNGFLGGYLEEGGAENGGCGAAGGGLAGSAVLAALGFWLSRRKRS